MLPVLLQQVALLLAGRHQACVVNGTCAQVTTVHRQVHFTNMPELLNDAAFGPGGKF